ncbi:MAG: tripartite tricarboxylate transporter substrate binding protein [Burkholderiaceae bacterium]|nr:tripartite tricarboxylate transporter substrate binding protein [Rhodoferax sp.]MCP5285712.1 tripartite tricarboxylate transporter substrate binding protein [Burkholderiaceae bacterium]
MTFTRRQVLLAAAALPVLPAASQAALPDKPLTLVVPYPAGGPADGFGRALADALGQRLKQIVIVENKSGAGGALGVQSVARATPDTYTIGMAGNGATIFSPLLTSKLLVDVQRESTLIGKMVRTPNFLVVGPNVQAKTVQELITQAKAQPGKFTVASAGIGTGPHILAELFKQTAGVDMLHVPYKGAAPALKEVMGGQVDMFFGEAPGVLPLIKGGKLRALLVTSTQRVRWLPEVPCSADVGLPQVVADGFYGLVGPTGMPADVAAALTAAVGDALRAPALAERFEMLGGIPEPSDGVAYRAYLQSEQARWAPVIQKAGIKLE